MKKTFNHEINLKITSKNPNKNVLFNKSDEFINEIINAINKKHPDSFELVILPFSAGQTSILIYGFFANRNPKLPIAEIAPNM